MDKKSNSEEILTEIQARFYSSLGFESVYDHETRKAIIKSIIERLKDPEVGLNEKKNMLQYLDAQAGDVPQTGPDSGKTVNEVLVRVEFVKAANGSNSVT